MPELTGMMKNKKALFTGKQQDYKTPQWLFDKLDKEFHFTLDPCASSDTSLSLKTNMLVFTEHDNGLTKSWARNNVFVNPPYNQVTKWVEKAFDEMYVNTDNNRANIIVLLLAARTDTIWFHKYIYNRREINIKFLRGRLGFENAGAFMEKGQHNCAPFPSMIVVMSKGIT